MKVLSRGNLALVFFLAAGFLLPNIAAAGAAGGSTKDLTSALCSKMLICSDGNAKLRRTAGRKAPVCIDKLSGNAGMTLWDNFGVTGYGLRASDVEAMVSRGEMLVNQGHLAQCVNEINALDCGTVGETVKKELTDAEYLISDKGMCPKVYGRAVAPETTAGQLIDSICNTYANCQKGAVSPVTAKETCVAELNGPSGKSLWDEFGLKKKFQNRFTATEIENQIDAKRIAVNVQALNECRQEKIPEIACKKFDKHVAAEHWASIDKAVGRKAPCSGTLKVARKVQFE